jgi:hypothetical protein
VTPVTKVADSTDPTAAIVPAFISGAVSQPGRAKRSAP